eukprot:6173632-Pleurochrysis_carterae.AAC.4
MRDTDGALTLAHVASSLLYNVYAVVRTLEFWVFISSSSVLFPPLAERVLGTCPFYERLGFCVAELAPSELRFELAAGAVLAQLARGEKLACMVWDAADNS